MRPLDFYRAGVALAAGASTESLRRTAVGRLYYGLHHEACCRYFRKNPGARPLDRNRRHAQLADRYRNSPEPAAQQIWRRLSYMAQLRREADYELVPPLRFENQSISDEQLMELALDISRQLLAALECYSPGAAPDGCRCPVAYSRG